MTRRARVRKQKRRDGSSRLGKNAADLVPRVLRDAPRLPRAAPQHEGVLSITLRKMRHPEVPCPFDTPPAAAPQDRTRPRRTHDIFPSSLNSCPGSSLGTPDAEAREQGVADPQCVGDYRQGRVDRSARRKKAAIDDIEIVHLVRPAIDIERRRSRVPAEADRAVLVTGSGDRDTLAKIGILRQQPRLAIDMVEQMAQLAG